MFSCWKSVHSWDIGEQMDFMLASIAGRYFIWILLQSAGTFVGSVSQYDPPFLPQTDRTTFATQISLLEHITQIGGHHWINLPNVFFFVIFLKWQSDKSKDCKECTKKKIDQLNNTKLNNTHNHKWNWIIITVNTTHIHTQKFGEVFLCCFVYNFWRRLLCLGSLNQRRCFKLSMQWY